MYVKANQYIHEHAPRAEQERCRCAPPMTDSEQLSSLVIDHYAPRPMPAAPSIGVPQLPSACPTSPRSLWARPACRAPPPPLCALPDVLEPAADLLLAIRGRHLLPCSAERAGGISARRVCEQEPASEREPAQMRAPRWRHTMPDLPAKAVLRRGNTCRITRFWTNPPAVRPSRQATRSQAPS
jgi:hypothetical protein